MATMDLIQEHASKLPAEKQGEVLDFVLFLEQQGRVNDKPATLPVQQKELATLLNNLAGQIEAFEDIDPLQWQREQRNDTDMRDSKHAD